MIADLLVAVNWASLGYLVMVNGTYLFIVLLAYGEIRGELRGALYAEDKVLFRHAAVLKPVSIIAPAYNEAVTAVDSLRALLSLNYPEYEVILVNDGSKDETLAILIEHFHLRRVDRAPTHALSAKQVRGVYRSGVFPNLTVIDKENGGKADALNVGINYCRHPLFMAIDTDTLLAKDALLKMARPFVDDPRTVAVGGLIRVVNGCEVVDGEVVRFSTPRHLLPRMQIVEYFRAFLFGRAGWGRLNLLLIISGAFGMFRTDRVIRAGGYWTDTVGEDVELVMRLHRHMREQREPYVVRFIASPVCWTEVPESLPVLMRQRNRWARGLLESMWRHRVMLFNPRYGALGVVAMPFNLIVEALGGLIELGGLALLTYNAAVGNVDTRFVVIYLLASLMLAVVVSWGAILLDELIAMRLPTAGMLLGVMRDAVWEVLMFRQVNSWCRLRGVIAFLRGESGWGSMLRTGFASPTRQVETSSELARPN